MDDSESPHLRLAPAAEPAPWAPIEVAGPADDGVRSLVLERLLRNPGRRLTATDLLPMIGDKTTAALITFALADFYDRVEAHNPGNHTPPNTGPRPLHLRKGPHAGDVEAPPD